jgi:glycosyltransferase involved in cell wall biosynthesis
VKLLISAAGTLDGQVGGGQVYVQDLVRGLAARGHQLSAVSAAPWDGGDEPYRIRWRQFEGIEVANVSINPGGIDAGQGWTGLSQPTLYALHAVVDRVGPELIHLNGFKPALTKVAAEREIPHVVTAHHGGVACPVGTLLRPDDSICQLPLSDRQCPSCYCKQLRGGSRMGRMLAAIPPAVYRPLGRALNVLPNATYAGRTLMYPWLVERAIEGKRYAIQTASHWIAPSQAIARVLERNGASPARIHHVPYAIKPFASVPLQNAGKRPVRFGYFGRIAHVKGVHVLLEAFARLPNGAAQLDVVGAAQFPGEKEYLDRTRRPVEGRQGISFHGAVPHDQLAKLMAGIDVLVLPSIYLEVYGLVLLEAFAVGRPAIATASGGPAEAVRDGVDGLVVPPNDVEALAAAMRHLVDRPERIAQLAANITPVCTLEEHVTKLEAVYRQAMEPAAATADLVAVET